MPDSITLDLGRLETEIRNQAALVVNRLNTRRDHPSFGITKSALRSDYAELCGMLRAWAYVSGTWEHNGTCLLSYITDDIVSVFSVNLADLLIRIDKS